MATRGERKIVSVSVGGDVEILNRGPFESVPMTIDFTGVDDVDKETGKKIVKAGTPINKSGAPVTTTPWEGAWGILLHDAYEDNPDGALLRKAYINKTVAAAHSGLDYDEALEKLFPQITFEADQGK